VRAGDSIAIDADDWHVDDLGGNVYLVSGRTQPGMIVRWQGSQENQAFAGPDGLFRLQINTPSIETAVEISDDRGNRSGFIISLRNGSVVRRY
jgi:hypothetical protein